ncbi:MAG: hypothetical protein IT176_12020 [Acidobacteria bacterium]|nr:hypothetical protein [Acidobacteriota bacterium]
MSAPIHVAAGETVALCDDPAFTAALAELEIGEPEAGGEEAGPRRTLAEWAEAEGIALSPPDDSIDEVTPAEARPPAMSAVAFLGLMGVGAAAAVMLFHAEVLRIVTAF